MGAIKRVSRSSQRKQQAYSIVAMSLGYPPPQNASAIPANFQHGYFAVDRSDTRARTSDLASYADPSSSSMNTVWDNFGDHNLTLYPRDLEHANVDVASHCPTNSSAYSQSQTPLQATDALFTSHRAGSSPFLNRATSSQDLPEPWSLYRPVPEPRSLASLEESKRRKVQPSFDKYHSSLVPSSGLKKPSSVSKSHQSPSSASPSGRSDKPNFLKSGPKQRQRKPRAENRPKIWCCDMCKCLTPVKSEGENSGYVYKAASGMPCESCYLTERICYLTDISQKDIREIRTKAERERGSHWMEEQAMKCGTYSVGPRYNGSRESLLASLLIPSKGHDDIVSG